MASGTQPLADWKIPGYADMHGSVRPILYFQSKWAVGFSEKEKKHGWAGLDCMEQVSQLCDLGQLLSF